MTPLAPAGYPTVSPMFKDLGAALSNVTRRPVGIRQSVVREDTPEVRGLVNTVRHLVAVEEVD